METRGRTKEDGNGDGSGNGNESSSSRDGSGDEDGNGDGNEDGIGEGGRAAMKRKKPLKSCRRYVGNGGDLGGKRGKFRQERVGSVNANPDNLENSKGAGGELKAPRAQVRTVQVEGVCPLCCV